ncbi:MAG: hypothetical protein HFH62_13060 [Lachnospiraceae bacterium]|nr:hypothetical protein [Lachnospiraceae bacterium]
MRKFFCAMMVILGVLFIKSAVCSAAECKEVNYLGNVKIVSEDISDNAYNDVDSLYRDLIREYDENLDVNKCFIGRPITIYSVDNPSYILSFPVYVKDSIRYMINYIDMGNNTDSSYAVSMEIGVANELSDILKNNVEDTYLFYVENGETSIDSMSQLDVFYNSNGDTTFASLSFEEKIDYLTILKDMPLKEDATTNTIQNIKYGAGYSLNTKYSKILDIKKFVKQGNYPLCWAASVATAKNYIKNTTNTSATDVANKYRKKYPLENITYKSGASLSQTKKALSLYNLSYTKKEGIVSFNKIKSDITNKKPLIMGTKVYSDKGLKKYVGSHMMTIYGFNSSVFDMFSVWDPNGNKVVMTYNSTNCIAYFSNYYFKWTVTLY